MPELTILHSCSTLQLAGGRNTLIDESDFLVFGSLLWHSRAQKKRGRFYVVRNVTVGKKRQRGVFLHRVIAGAGKGFHVDHRNGDGLDNRRENLRVATRSQNAQNQRSPVGKSRFKGVSSAGPYWRARIRADGKLIQLGCHRTEEAAARAYDAAAREHFGEFACTNEDLHGDY